MPRHARRRPLRGLTERLRVPVVLEFEHDELVPPVPGEIFVADERRFTGELLDPRSVASIEDWGGARL